MKTEGRFAEVAGAFSSLKGQISPSGSHLNAPHDDLPMTSEVTFLMYRSGLAS